MLYKINIFLRFVTGTLALVTILALVALDALATAEPVIEEVGHVVVVVFSFFNNTVLMHALKMKELPQDHIS